MEYRAQIEDRAELPEVKALIQKSEMLFTGLEEIRLVIEDLLDVAQSLQTWLEQVVAQSWQ